MKDEWVIDVLNDLRSFARSNDLPRLSEYLDDALVVAHSELSQRSAKTEMRIVGPDGQRHAARTGTKP
ncbi:MAG: hypothetical protein ACU0DW_10485 [Shimia sp.]